MEQTIYKYIWRFSKRQQIYLMIVTAISMPVLYASLELPKIIINEAIDGTDFPIDLFGIQVDQIPFLLVLCVAFIVLVNISGMFQMHINIYRGRAGEGLSRRLRYQLIQNVLRFPLPHFRTISTGEIVSIVTTEIEPLGRFMAAAYSLPALQGGTLLTLLAFMFAQDWRFGVAATALYPVQIYIIPKLQKSINRLAEERVAAVRKLSERVSEMALGAPEIHANDTGQYELADFGRRLGTISRIMVESFRKKAFIKLLNNFLAQLTPFFFYSIGGYLVISGELSFGALVAALAAYKDLAAPWKKLLSYYLFKEDARIKYTQISERFQPPGMTEPTLLAATENTQQDLTGTVQASNITLEDDEGMTLISGASFTFSSDDHVAVVGMPGSGAADLAQLMARQLIPTSGSLNIGPHNLSDMPEAVTGRQLAYVGPEVYINSGTIADNLYYALKNYPRRVSGATSESEKRRAASELSGTSNLDIDADWIDYPALGLDGPEALTQSAIQVLDEVGLGDDVFELGLRRIINPAENPDLANGILLVRSTVHEWIDDPKIAGLIQVFDAERYNIHASVAENILFGTPVDDNFAIDQLGRNPLVLEALEKVNLIPIFLEMGLNIATLMIDLFKNLSPNHDFFEQFSFIKADDMPDFQRIVNLAGARGLDAIAGEDRERLMDLPFKLIVARHRPDLIDDAIEERLLQARHAFAKLLPDDKRGAIEFFNINNYNAASNILSNALFGKVVSDKTDSRARVVEFVTRIIDNIGLRDAVLKVGLDYDVGIGGKRLSQVQRQRLGFARALLKRARITVVNDAAAALSKPDQDSLLRNVRNAIEKRGLIWVASKIETSSEFDKTLIMEGGRIHEQTADGAPGESAAVPTSEPETAIASAGFDHDVELLAGVAFFAGLDRSKLRLLAFASEHQTLEAGEILFHQGDWGDMAYVIVDGDFNILIETADGPVSVAHANPGVVIGELALLCDAPRTATLVAESSATLLCITKGIFLQLIADNAEIAANLARLIAGRLAKTMEGYDDDHQPLYDEATGLANRKLFIDRLTFAATSDHREDKVASLVLMDCQGLDAIGHAIAENVEDEMVKNIVKRLKSTLRKSDSLARLHRLVFGIVAKHDEAVAIEMLRDRIVAQFAEPLLLDGTAIDISQGLRIDVHRVDAKNIDDVISLI